MTIILDKKIILKRLLLVVLLLAIGNFVAYLVQIKNYELSEYSIRMLSKSLDFNTEENFPTLFSSLLLFTNSLALLIIAMSYERFSKNYNYWFGLSIVFCFIGLDEMLQMHEHLVNPVRNALNTTGYFYFAWFIPYLIIMAVLGIAYFKFFISLPKRTLTLFISSAVIFLSGAVGMEAIGGHFAEFNSKKTLTYFIMYTTEELLEMTGSILFFYSLLDYKQINLNELKVSFR